MGYKRKIFEGYKKSKTRKKVLIKGADYSIAQRQCFKKNAYPTERMIIKKINEIAELGRTSLRYYQCPYCKLYHISSKAIEGQKFIS